MKPIKERGKKSDTKTRNMFQFSASQFDIGQHPVQSTLILFSQLHRSSLCIRPLKCVPTVMFSKWPLVVESVCGKKGGWGRGNLKKRLLGCQFAHPVKPTPESEPMLMPLYAPQLCISAALSL